MNSGRKNRVKRALEKAAPKLPTTLLVQWVDGSYHDFEGNAVDPGSLRGKVVGMSPNVAKAVDHTVIIDEADARACL